MSDNQKSWIKIQWDEFGDDHIRDEIFRKGQDEWFQNRQIYVWPIIIKKRGAEEDNVIMKHLCWEILWWIWHVRCLSIQNKGEIWNISREIYDLVGDFEKMVEPWKNLC